MIPYRRQDISEADIQAVVDILRSDFDRREKTDPVGARENADFLTLERIKKCPKECV